MNDNGDKQTQAPVQPLADRPQIVITLLPNNQVHASGPTDMKLMFHMLGEFLKQVGMNVEFKAPSPIIKPAPGTVIK